MTDVQQAIPRWSWDVRRFTKEAPPAERAAFAKDLITALDGIGCEAGEMFSVVLADVLMENVDKLASTEGDLAEQKADAEEAIDDLERFKDLVADYERGIIDKPELFAKVLRG